MDGLNELLLQISSELGIGIEFLKSNFIDQFPQIGRWLFFRYLIDNLILEILLLTVVIMVFAAVIWLIIIDFGGFSEEKRIKFKEKFLKFCPIVYGSTILFYILSLIIPYMINPKYWTIQRILEMLN